jgi:hypothetical protein
VSGSRGGEGVSFRREMVSPGAVRRLLRALPLVAVFSCAGDFVLPEEPAEGPKLGPGEVCFAPQPGQVRARFEPRFLVLAPGQKRSARLVVDPDVCDPLTVTFVSSDPAVSDVSGQAAVDYGHPTIGFDVFAGELGSSVVTALVPRGDGTDVVVELPVDVLEATVPHCDAGDDVTGEVLEAGATIAAAGTLAGASVTLPERADAPNEGSFLWSVQPFPVGIGCIDAGAVPPGHAAMGPAVRFGEVPAPQQDPVEKVLPRDLPLSIPLNPALLPETARWNELRLAYSSPRFPQPRVVAATDPRVEKVDGVWRLSFKGSRLGTYQAVVASGAGSSTKLRRLAHRAVIGVSMGGAGAAQFGLRHHRLFDVVAAMGGPVDWTYMLDHIQANQLGGFRPIAPGTQLADIALTRVPCAGPADCQADETCMPDQKCAFMPRADEPYEHGSTFDTWWYEYPAMGNGSSFNRREYVQIIRDLALMFGNPVSYNPLALHLPAGVDPDDPSQTGDHPGDACKIYVQPYDGPGHDEQSALYDQCPIERCQHHQRLTGYYDDEFNPDGTFPVITFCDGSPQDPAFSPYSNTWTPSDNNQPVEVGLAVDYNDNGVRDELEPVIRGGHEPYDDVGEDGLPSELEPGFSQQNLDPAGDDYDARYSPGGHEGDHRWEEGEPFDDVGLDGVAGTATSPYDSGEGDGTFTVTPGLQRFWDYDAHSVVRGTSSAADLPLDDAALARIDVWTDGGTRDLFNSLVAADHFLGAFAGRGRDVAHFSNAVELPGLDPAQPDAYSPSEIVWNDLQGAVLYRYGHDEPEAADIESGSGQHVGTIEEIARRLQTALYFIESRWPDAPHAQVAESADDPIEGALPEGCDQSSISTGNCTFDFTSTFGRTGPVGISLPPGYFHKAQQDIRYPVIFILHGYGQTPEDLQAAVAFLSNWMNGSDYSQATRLGKAIVVYVDGRCRWQGDDDRAECIRGTFFTDSIRPDGPQMDAWWLELMDYVDQHYRTMGESQIQWPQ